MGLDEVIKIVAGSPWFYAGAAALLIIIFWAFYRKNARKALLKRSAALQVRYAAVKTVPLAFKMNKATALSKVNPDVAKIIEDSKPGYDEVQEDLRTLSEMINTTDDLVATGDYRDAGKNNSDIAALLDKTEQGVKKINGALDEVLKQETEQREKINVLKEDFRKIKIGFNENSSRFVYSYEAIEEKILEIEKLFSSFEEWMYASDFQKAAEIQDDIVGKLDYLKELYEKLPQLLGTARSALPKAAEEVAADYAQAKQKGVYLKHLDIGRNVEVINDAMRTDLNSLKKAEIEGVPEHLADCLTRLRQLRDQIVKESGAYDLLGTEGNKVFNEVTEVRGTLADIQKTYRTASERFGLNDLGDKLASFNTLVSGYESKATDLKKQIKDGRSPATGILIGLRELQQEIDLNSTELKETKGRLDQACQDENRARIQLLKLHLIMNEMRSKVRKHRLRSISESYDADVHTAENYINELENILSGSPLDIQALNKTLQEALDFVYTLYNNVNKILGTASMVEEAIVVANRCRSTYPEVDSELNHSELAYRNGEYTKALQTAFGAIDSIYPHQAEALIKSNSVKETAG